MQAHTHAYPYLRAASFPPPLSLLIEREPPVPNLFTTSATTVLCDVVGRDVFHFLLLARGFGKYYKAEVLPSGSFLERVRGVYKSWGPI